MSENRYIKVGTQILSSQPGKIFGITCVPMAIMIFIGITILIKNDNSGQFYQWLAADLGLLTVYSICLLIELVIMFCTSRDTKWYKNSVNGIVITSFLYLLSDLLFMISGIAVACAKNYDIAKPSSGMAISFLVVQFITFIVVLVGICVDVIRNRANYRDL